MNKLNYLCEKYEDDRDDNEKLKIIVLTKKNYDRLKDLGFCGESFNTVVGRLLDRLEQEDN